MLHSFSVTDCMTIHATYRMCQVTTALEDQQVVRSKICRAIRCPRLAGGRLPPRSTVAATRNRITDCMLCTTVPTLHVHPPVAADLCLVAWRALTLQVHPRIGTAESTSNDVTGYLTGSTTVTATGFLNQHL